MATPPRGPGPAARRAVSTVRSWGRRMRAAQRARRVLTVRAGPAAGMRIRVRDASGDYVDGDIEVPVQHAIASLIRPGDVFFDIGANVGFFSLVAAASAHGDATVVAFEPRRDIAEVLDENLRRNDVTASVWAVAVADRGGIASLLVASHPGGATIEPSKAFDTTGIEHVPQVAIDELVESGRVPVPDLVKIDVEGAEPAVLRGMERTLRLGRTTVVFEVDAPELDAVEAQYAEIEEILDGFGLSCERLDTSYEQTAWRVLHAVARPRITASDGETDGPAGSAT